MGGTYTDGDASAAVGAAPGYEKKEDRITVHVSKGCVWELQTKFPCGQYSDEYI